MEENNTSHNNLENVSVNRDYSSPKPDHIVFSFYYVNSNNEVDKILKNKVPIVDNTCVFHRNKLFNEIMKYKQQYYQNVRLHEILFYQNTEEPISYFQEIGSLSAPQDVFKKVHYAYDIPLSPTDEYFRSLTHIYVIFKAKSSLLTPSICKSTLTVKNKKRSKCLTRKV